MTNKTILEKNDFFSDHDISLGSRFAPRHATCDFQLNLIHWLCWYLKSTKFFHLPFSVCPPSVLSSIVQQRTIFKKKKRGIQFLGDRPPQYYRVNHLPRLIASSVGHRFARGGSTKQECWYCLKNIRAFILHWVWCSALGFYWCGFDVKVEKDVSVKEQKPGSLVPFFITAVVRLGEWDAFWELQP